MNAKDRSDLIKAQIESLKQAYKPKRIELEIEYLKYRIEMKYEWDIDFKSFKLAKPLGLSGIIPDNEPFESQFPYKRITRTRLDCTELINKLDEMKRKKPNREKIYEAVDVMAKDDYYMCWFVQRLSDGFNDLSADLKRRQETIKIKAYLEDKKHIRGLEKKLLIIRPPRFPVDPYYELYSQGIAQLEPKGRGHPTDFYETEFIKDLYSFLSPLFDWETERHERFQGRGIPTSYKIIKEIFEAFYGISKSQDSFKKRISKD